MSIENANPPTDKRLRSRWGGAGRWIFRALLLAGALVIARMWYRGTVIDPHEYNSSELANGPISQIIAWPENHKAVQVSRLSSLPADQLWKVITDQGRF